MVKFLIKIPKVFIDLVIFSLKAKNSVTSYFLSKKEDPNAAEWIVEKKFFATGDFFSTNYKKTYKNAKKDAICEAIFGSRMLSGLVVRIRNVKSRRAIIIDAPGIPFEIVHNNPNRDDDVICIYENSSNSYRQKDESEVIRQDNEQYFKRLDESFALGKSIKDRAKLGG